MTYPENASGRLERWIGSVILLSLVVIAIGVFLKQSSFNPAVLVSRNLMQTPAAAGAANTIAWIPAALKEFGAPEHFTPDNLYDKIDGKAELYTSAGVVAMHCQRFVLKDAPDDWLEWFVYDMGKVPQAFSVFSTQRRAEGQPLELTEYAYKTPNALFFVSGSNYVEAVAASTNQPLMNAILEMARQFVASGSAGGSQMTELQLLPPEHMVPGSATLQATDAFGFDQFKNVFTAQYRLDDADAIAFVISCSSPDAATALRDAYRAFLMANGGKAVGASVASELGMPIEIVGAFEMVFSRGKVVAGVHSAATLAAAEALGKSLHQRITLNAK
jgi:hypothetical protein